ncbi:imidazole glycerol phosphate synthase subunit HisF [uncultured Chitinophaga sp.]|uniref:imidazole glycerol phosphate synthase subunit HisF n=1 Tax=uncultured Chitinophaga sp. TaxID=339340 RepID=UPI0025E68FC7|nr:imidazole glycerol phosphate synthase cyclase subunit [uncultured Chitinophaga sp.]
MNVRIIPRLDIKGPNLVKGIHLEGLRVLGKPEAFARYYYENGADELFFQDTVASLYDRNSLHDIITLTAREIFIPLTVGGGLRTIQDIRDVLRAGADKVSINTAAIKNPAFIREAALKFGSSTIVVAIEAIRQQNGEYLAYTDNGREHTGIEVLSWARQVEELGAGEIVITSVDREGTGLGFDVELTRMVAEQVGIPVIAHGGASSPEDIARAVTAGKADAVAVSSILHYDYITHQQHAGNYEKEGNTSFLTSGRGFNKIKPCTLQDIRGKLISEKIPTRSTI